MTIENIKVEEVETVEIEEVSAELEKLDLDLDPAEVKMARRVRHPLSRKRKKLIRQLHREHALAGYSFYWEKELAPWVHVAPIVGATSVSVRVGHTTNH
jgi:CO dehydrogenase/acetyl-CoA synthase delta subunit